MARPVRTVPRRTERMRNSDSGPSWAATRRPIPNPIGSAPIGTSCLRTAPRANGERMPAAPPHAAGAWTPAHRAGRRRRVWSRAVADGSPTTTALRTATATRHVTPLREGGSLPGLVEGDDDGLYVLKFRGAGQGSRALVAELVAGELARAAGFAGPGNAFAGPDP